MRQKLNTASNELSQDDLPPLTVLEEQFISSRCATIRSWKRPAPKRTGSALHVRGIDDPLHKGVADGPAGHLIRSLFNHMGFDEHRLFRWGLHHKLVQALVLSAFAPGSFPATRGLVSVISQGEGGTVRDRVRSWKELGYLFKKTLTTGSGEHGRVDFTRQAIATLETNSALDATMDHEELMLQKRIEIAEEFRVHSVEDQVAEHLTVGRYRGGYAHNPEHDYVNEYVSSLLKVLPDGLTTGTFHNWDVARTLENEFVVLEVNLTGFNPSFRPGFQCSGFFRGPQGPIMLARFLRFVESRYGVKIRFPRKGAGYSEECFALYSEVRQLLRH